jgi:hypothetical protein
MHDIFFALAFIAIVLFPVIVTTIPRKNSDDDA